MHVGLASECREIREGTHHEECPDGVVDEDGGRCDEHAESYEAVELQLSDRAYIHATAVHTILKFWVRSVGTGVCSVLSVDVVRAPT